MVSATIDVDLLHQLNGRAFVLVCNLLCNTVNVTRQARSWIIALPELKSHFCFSTCETDNQARRSRRSPPP